MDNSKQPLVSIIIRARNEEEGLKRLLPVITQQETNFEFEVWVLNNESTDNTAVVAKTHNANLQVIPRREFNYSAALNLGAELARGKIVVNLSAHCIPQSKWWLSYLVEPLLNDDKVIASYGRQWFDPKISPYTAEGNEPFFPSDPNQRHLVAFSNANAAIRKDILLQHPFNPHIKILEDHLFYLELSEHGQFEYAPHALVNHEHYDFDMRYNMKRWIIEGWAFHFILKHRRLATPYKPHGFFQTTAVRGYWALGRKLARAGQRKIGPLTFPFFLVREIFWIIGWLQGRLLFLRTAKRDRDLLFQMISHLNPLVSNDRLTTPSPNSNNTGAPLIKNYTGQDIRDWPEEWQLKADWPFLRDNIANFIRQCYDSDIVFRSPVLEIGASGQNDYLDEKYNLITSNLEYNRQGSSLEIDMENMHRFEDNSIGSILCSEVVEHIKHPDRAFAEAFRVLCPGGKLVITTPYTIVIHNTPEDGGFHGRNFTPQGLELCLVEAGFKVNLLETRAATPTRQKLMPSNIFAIAEKPFC